MEVDEGVTEVYRLREGDPLSLRVDIRRHVELQRGDWLVRVETHCAMTATETDFHLSHELDAYEGNKRVFTRASTRSIPRQLV